MFVGYYKERLGIDTWSFGLGHLFTSLLTKYIGLKRAAFKN